MASLRKFKKEIDYLVSEVVSDCYTCLYLNHKSDRDGVISIVEEAVALRNRLFEAANHPQEKHNPRLVRKYYRQLRNEMFDQVDALFRKLSDTCKEEAEAGA